MTRLTRLAFSSSLRESASSLASLSSSDVPSGCCDKRSSDQGGISLRNSATISPSRGIFFLSLQNSPSHALATCSQLTTPLRAFSRSQAYCPWFWNTRMARSMAKMRSPRWYASKVKPLPSAVSGLNSETVSLSPPVLYAMTGVPATKNSCCTMPPGSNIDGMTAKSAPRLTSAPSVKNSFGSAQKLCLNCDLRWFICEAHRAE
mmetsp:Transcript_5459/g.12849  ORF Transcript_5459/g.12849 Transcript_5459/m.12849 type:complete len:204 (-) Transcript_5459:269-880(-)